MKIAINSKTSGKFEKKFLNNREHLVTEMVPIVGNSVMNGGLYPLDEVNKSFDQLHFLPAPNGHPKVNGELVSAFHPLAVNAFNIGGMVRNPRMDGDKVINEFWLDIEIANQSADGKELIRRIENGEEVGVSTGLNLKQEFVDNQEYSWVGRDFQFDHVAILLNEKAAGAHVGTKLTTNSDNVDIVNCAVLGTSEGLPEVSLTDKVINKLRDTFDLTPKNNAITTDSLEGQLRMEAKKVWPEEQFWTWVMMVFPTVNTVIFEVESKTEETTKLIRCTYSVDSNDQVSLNDDKVQVVKKVEFVEVDGDVNVNNSNPEEDDDMGDKNTEDKKDVTNSDELNVENAINLLESKGFRVNTKEEADKLDFFVKNQDRFESIINAEENELKTLRENLVANSDMTEDDVAGMSRDMLIRLDKSLNPPQNYQVNAGGQQPRVINEDVSDEDFEDSYTTYTDDNGGE